MTFSTLLAITGLLLLKTEPSGANIVIDGASVGETPRLITNLDAESSHTVKFIKAGYVTQTISVKFNGREPMVREEKLVADSGIIVITSDPAGVEVLVNDIPRGVTPITVSGVPKGRSTVKFRMAGFTEEKREVSLKAGETQHLSISLNAKPGTLYLQSDPAGAQFYVDDRPYGKSPVTIADLKPGEYNVVASLDGYAKISRNICIRAGEAVREEFKLANVMGRLEVRSSPAGATVELDGRVVGVTSTSDPGREFSDPLTIDSLMEGEHDLKVRLDGYEQVVRHPFIRNSKTSQHSVRLKRVFTPDTELETIRGVKLGVLVEMRTDYVVMEVREGIIQSFPRSEVRKITPLKTIK